MKLRKNFKQLMSKKLKELMRKKMLKKNHLVKIMLTKEVINIYEQRKKQNKFYKKSKFKEKTIIMNPII
jgi:hypothetical protein